MLVPTQAIRAFGFEVGVEETGVEETGVEEVGVEEVGGEVETESDSDFDFLGFKSAICSQPVRKTDKTARMKKYFCEKIRTPSDFCGLNIVVEFGGKTVSHSNSPNDKTVYPAALTLFCDPMNGRKPWHAALLTLHF
ncbi:hypothetical protein [Larkinella terrae]|uniref:hypothetical protein n=1 Tax=Larkinella terrae TaxID=2025311 RepID=UPI0014781F4F|nr:hypothetical protein [Larkinella terrae]